MLSRILWSRQRFWPGTDIWLGRCLWRWRWSEFPPRSGSIWKRNQGEEEMILYNYIYDFVHSYLSNYDLRTMHIILCLLKSCQKAEKNIIYFSFYRADRINPSHFSSLSLFSIVSSLLKSTPWLSTHLRSFLHLSQLATLLSSFHICFLLSLSLILLAGWRCHRKTPTETNPINNNPSKTFRLARTPR